MTNVEVVIAGITVEEGLSGNRMCGNRIDCTTAFNKEFAPVTVCIDCQAIIKAIFKVDCDLIENSVGTTISNIDSRLIIDIMQAMPLGSVTRIIDYRCNITGLNLKIDFAGSDQTDTN